MGNYSYYLFSISKGYFLMTSKLKKLIDDNKYIIGNYYSISELGQIFNNSNCYGYDLYIDCFTHILKNVKYDNEKDFDINFSDYDNNNVINSLKNNQNPLNKYKKCYEDILCFYREDSIVFNIKIHYCKYCRMGKYVIIESYVVNNEEESEYLEKTDIHHKDIIKCILENNEMGQNKSICKPINHNYCNILSKRLPYDIINIIRKYENKMSSNY